MGICCTRHLTTRSSPPVVELCDSIDMEKISLLQGKAKSGGSAFGEEADVNTDMVIQSQHDENSEAEADERIPKQEERVVDIVPEFLTEKFNVIENGLNEYCENSTASSFMEIYTCIYDLCNRREHKNAVCRAVYELYRRETQSAVRQLATACRRMSGALPPSLQVLSSEVLLEWQRLERRFHALQASFGYLDRYYVPRASLENLSTLRLSILAAENLEEEAQLMWNILAASLRDGHASISFQRMRELADAWGTLTRVAGMQDTAAAAGASSALREHLAATFTEGREPLGRSGAASGTATDRVLGMQRPLVRVIIEFLSEQDLCQVYSVRSMQRSV